jgi:hypothetical protein
MVSAPPSGRINISAPPAPAVSGIYSVDEIAGAAAYTWSVSNSAATIVSGQGTRYIELRVQQGYTGVIVLSVRASNCAGTGARGTLPIVIRPMARNNDYPAKDATGSLQVFPNPNTGMFTLVTPMQEKEARAQIFSMDGRMIKSIIIPAHTVQMKIDLGNYPAGAYHLRYIAGGNARSLKVVVVK